MISSSRLAELQHAPPAWKFCAAQSQKRFDRENAQRERIKRNDDERLPRFLDYHGTARKNVARAGGSEPGPPAEARPLGRRSCGGAPPRPHEALTQKARKFNARKFGPNLGPSSKADLETCGKYKELNRKLRAPTRRKARAREEPSPGPPATETDARPPGHQPRGGAPARPQFSRGQEGPT